MYFKFQTHLALLVGLTAFLQLDTNKAQAMDIEDIQNSYIEHAAKAQLYRWYQFYERPEGGVDNAVDILTDDVFVKSSLGEAKGKDAYKERVMALPSTWQNGHIVKSVDVNLIDAQNIELSAVIDYFNTGMAPDNQVMTSNISYKTTLIRGDELLPKFSTIEITPSSQGNTKAFVDAYAQNRALSTVHYWLALIEDPSRNADPIQEILSDAFSLNFSSGKITDFDGVKSWIAGPASSVSASTHIITSFSATSEDDINITLSMTFEWFGILPNGQMLTAETRHDWTLKNDVKERFARIQSMDVEILKPFRPFEG